ncbi:MAG: hypothetical protein OXU39_01430 [Gemmatimonadota bacterium]|nr:hypothetical protein [Gemmatimonadota bacterium]MDE3004731.1 hypothetical protein [Gemmatimonadota bacterium]
MEEINRGSTLRSRATQAFVIVSSILIAFGLDAWGSSRAENRAFVDELTTVLEEMNRNKKHLEDWRAIHQRIADSIEELLIIPSSATNGHMALASDTLLLGATLMATSNPSSGGVRMLTNSGRLALIENRELRVALSGWDDFVLDVSEDEIAGYNWTVEHLVNWTINNWSTEAVATNRSLNTYFWLNRESGEALPYSESEIPLADAFRNLLRIKKSFADNSMREISDLLRIVSQVIGWIENELPSEKNANY